MLKIRTPTWRFPQDLQMTIEKQTHFLKLSQLFMGQKVGCVFHTAM